MKRFAVFLSFIFLLFSSCETLSLKHLDGDVYSDTTYEYSIFACIADPFKTVGLTLDEYVEMFPNQPLGYFSSFGNAYTSAAEVKDRALIAMSSVAYNYGYRYFAVIDNGFNIQNTPVTANTFFIGQNAYTNVSSGTKYAYTGTAILFLRQEELKNIKSHVQINNVIDVNDYALQTKK